MRILVTGGGGFIGSNFLYYLKGAHPDYEIRCLDLLTYAGHIESIRPLIDQKYVTFIKGDIRKSTDVSRAINGETKRWKQEQLLKSCRAGQRLRVQA